MEIILLEKVRNLGGIGATVKVRNGYARNFLIPYGKAVVANAANLEKFAKLREELEKRAEQVLQQAKDRAEQLADKKLVIKVKATEDGKLFGSVNVHMIADAFAADGLEVKRGEIELPQGAIRQLGEYSITVMLHTDVCVTVPLKVEAIS